MWNSNSSSLYSKPTLSSFHTHTHLPPVLQSKFPRISSVFSTIRLNIIYSCNIYHRQRFHKTRFRQNYDPRYFLQHLITITAATTTTWRCFVGNSSEDLLPEKNKTFNSSYVSRESELLLDFLGSEFEASEIFSRNKLAAAVGSRQQKCR